MRRATGGDGVTGGGTGVGTESRVVAESVRVESVESRGGAALGFALVPNGVDGVAESTPAMVGLGGRTTLLPSGVWVLSTR